MTLIQKEVKAVYLGETKVRPAYKPRTFTISRTEKSNMSSGWTYSDDAAGLTAGDGAFDDFFGYSAVLLNTSGVETAEMKQSGGVFTGAMSTLGNITSGDNVMIKFPVRGIKMSKSGSTVTLSITDGLGRESEGYQYFAFSKGTIDNITETKDQFYIGAYEGYISSSKLKSWSGKTSTTSYNYSNFQTYATNNGSGYDIAYFYQRMYIYALYIMKYGNPDAKATIGYGNIYGNKINTGGANSQTNASYGTTGNYTTACRLFGIENLWGNMNEWVGGLSTNSQYYMVVQLPGGAMTTTDIYSNANNDAISSIAGTNVGMFYPLAAVSGYGQYYWNPGLIYSNYYYTTSGFNYGYINASGPIALFNKSVSSAENTLGARLMYL